jgi:hypothetical protein
LKSEFEEEDPSIENKDEIKD